MLREIAKGIKGKIPEEFPEYILGEIYEETPIGISDGIPQKLFKKPE